MKMIEKEFKVSIFLLRFSHHFSFINFNTLSTNKHQSNNNNSLRRSVRGIDSHGPVSYIIMGQLLFNKLDVDRYIFHFAY